LKSWTFIDLFCGAGGLALGFTQAGFKSVYAVDFDKAAAETYRRNFRHEVWDRPIEELVKIPIAADVLVGGPPCQGFSPLGQMIPSPEHRHMNKLWRHYIRLVEQIHPRAFIVENVPEFLRSQEFKNLERNARELGYEVVADVLNAVDYGVPQRRKRGFVIAVKGAVPRLPEPAGQRVTVWDAIHDLPLEPDGKDWHIGRNPTPKSVKRYKCVPPGGNRFDLMKRRPGLTPRCWLEKPTGSTDVFGRLEWHKQALTIRTEFFKPEKGRYLHPQAHRPITHREAARLQTFPDNFEFYGSKIQVARQIGNAVPPKLARAVAEVLREVLDELSVSRTLAQSRRVAKAVAVAK
jgi:DNA (cytosine-5)-methyltransferase 1